MSMSKSARPMTNREQAELEIKRLRLQDINSKARRQAMFAISRMNQEDFDRILKHTKERMTEEAAPRIQREIEMMTQEQVDAVLRSRDRRRHLKRTKVQVLKAIRER